MAADTGTTETPHDVPERAVRQLGFGAYLAVSFAEAMSSVRLFGLGEQVGFAWYLAWLLPGALDVYALTMLRFSSSVPAANALRQKAMREATLALSLTVGCNALYEMIRSFAAQLPAWAPGALFVLVSALAPFVAGRIIHFHSMVGSTRAAAGSTEAPIEVPVEPQRDEAWGSGGTVEPGSTETDGTVPRQVPGTTEPSPVEPRAERPVEPEREVPEPRPARRGTRARGTSPKPGGAPVSSIVANPEWAAMAAEIVADRGPNVYLSVIMAQLGCSKSTASRLRADAIAEHAQKSSEDTDAEPERDLEAS